jgi:DNA repair protein RadC
VIAESSRRLLIILKAEQLGLFQQVVPVKGHMRGEHFVAPYTAGRKRRRAVAQAKEPEPIAARELSGDELIQAAIAELESRFNRNGPIFKDPNGVKDFLRLKIGGLEHEQFSVMFLTNRHQLIAYDELFRGTINAANVYPREVVKAALKHNAAAVVLAHNHPSGNAEPSVADVSLTDRLKSALGLVDIKVLDHMIATPSGIYSFAEKGAI